jgi:hypothetical protein
MSKLKDNKIRIFYIFISLLAAFCAYKYKEEILKSTDSFNEFSYVGGIATLIGLLITVLEIIHGIRVSKGIRDEARAIVTHAQKVDRASLISECLSNLDELNSYLSNEKYKISLKCFQYFRRNYTRISDTSPISYWMKETLHEVELELQSATHASAAAPLTRAKRVTLQNKIIAIKSKLEEINPATGGAYVP